MDESRHDGRREVGGYAWGTPHRVSSSQGNRIFALRKRAQAGITKNGWAESLVTSAHKIRT